MRLGLRGKLIVASLALIVVAGLASGAYLEVQLRGWLEGRLERELLHYARATKTVVEIAPRVHTIAEVDPIADRLGRARELRVTVIAQDGTVLGDSDLSADEVGEVENHSRRPEVSRAIVSGRGRSRRHSLTVGSDMLYMALPFKRADGQRGVVRVAMPLRQVDAAISGVRLLLLLGGLLGLSVAVFMSIFTANALSGALRRLVDSARELARGSTSSIAVDSRDELGRLAGSFNRLADDLERSMAALASERDRLETVLEGMTEAVVTMDGDRRLTLLNRAALKLLGVEEPPVGLTLEEAIPVPELQELVQRADGASASAEFDLPEPRSRRVLARVAKLKESRGFVVVLLDVTEMRRLERIRKDFVANVSHELRTPISVIQANAETLLDGALDDKTCAERFTEAIHRNSERLRRIVEELLDLSRIEAGRYPLAIDDVELAAAVNRALDAVQGRADAKRLTIEVNVPAELEVRADVKALDQVLLNLLDNAVKYTGEGGHVAVQATRRGKRSARIEVRDNGPGIDPQHRSRIFERFYRVDPGRSRDMGGTGLGLAIVKHLVEAMEGVVGVQSAAPRGSIFWVRLPRAPGHTKELDAGELHAGDPSASRRGEPVDGFASPANASPPPRALARRMTLTWVEL